MDNDDIARELLSIAKELMSGGDGVELFDRLESVKSDLAKVNSASLSQRRALQRLKKFMNNKFKTQGSFLKFVEEVGNAIIFGSFPPKDKKMLEQSKKRLMDGLGGLHDLFQQGDEVELNKRRDIYYKVQSELNRYFGNRMR